MRGARLFAVLAGPGLGLFTAVFTAAGATRVGAGYRSVTTDTLHLVRRPADDGLWVEPDLSLPHGESLIRQGLYGQRQFQRSYGRRSSVAWIPSVSGAPWTLPQILQGLDFNSLLAGVVAPDGRLEYPYDKFLWEGNDGSRINTFRPTMLPDDLDTDSLRLMLAGRPDDAAAHWIALAGIDEAANDVAPRFEQLQSLSTVRFSTPETAISAIRRRIPADSVTVWREALVFRETSGSTMETAVLAKRNHSAEVGLKTSEALASIASGLPDGPIYPRDRLGRAWRQVLSSQSLDVLSGMAVPAIRAEALARYDSAAATIDSIVKEGFATIRGEMDTRGESGGSYVLFNPLGHPRVGPAFVEISAPIPGEERASVRRSHGLALVNVPEVPAFGAVAIPMGRDGLPGIAASGLAPPNGGDNWMENAFLRVEIDPRSGAITSILDKANGRQALEPGGRANVLWVERERAAPHDAPDRSTGDKREELTTLLSLSSSVTARAASMTLVRQWGRSNVRQELILGRSAPFLEIRTEVERNHGLGALSVTFEPAGAADSATWEVPYGTDTYPGRTPTGPGHGYGALPGQSWADVSAGGYGLSVLAGGSQRWEYEIGTLRLDLLRSASGSDSIGNPELLSFRYAIYPHAGDWLAAGTHRLAAEYNVPLIAGIEPSHRGRLGKRFSLLSSDQLTVGVEWVKRAEEGEALVLRVVEWSGKTTETEIATACPRISARRANHLEDPGDPLPSTRGDFRIRLRAYEIATVLVECRG